MELLRTHLTNHAVARHAFRSMLVLSLFCGPAVGHTLDEGVITASVTPTSVAGELKLPRPILGFADEDNNGYLDTRELDSQPQEGTSGGAPRPCGRRPGALRLGLR